MSDGGHVAGESARGQGEGGRGRGGRGRGRIGHGGRGRGGEAMDREVQVSKKLSKLLRHDAEKEGLKLGKGGYVGLADVLSNRQIKSLQPPPTLSEIQRIVATNAKQRFSLISKAEYEASSSAVTSTNGTSPATTPSDSPADYLIRANQGHSIALSSSSLADLLTPLTLSSPSELPQTVVHGTRKDVWPAIVKSGGLIPGGGGKGNGKGRVHVHLATGVPAQLRESFKLDSLNELKGDVVADDDQAQEEGKAEAEKEQEVKSGMRNSSSLLIFVNIRKALEAGVEFWVSENGVVLTEGGKALDGKGGVLGCEFFELVVERGGGVLWRDGRAVE